MKDTYNSSDSIGPIIGRSNKKKIVNATVVKCNRLNIRSAADANATVVGVISPTDHVKVNLEESVGEYYRILEPTYGFANKKFLEVK